MSHDGFPNDTYAYPSMNHNNVAEVDANTAFVCAMSANGDVTSTRVHDDALCKKRRSQCAR